MFFFKILMFFSKNPWLQCKIFIFNALSSKFDLSFEDVLLNFPSLIQHLLHFHCAFIALLKMQAKCNCFCGGFIDCTLVALSKAQSKCNGFWEIFTLHESNKISLKNGTLSKTIEERHIKQNHHFCDLDCFYNQSLQSIWSNRVLLTTTFYQVKPHPTYVFCL